MRAYLDLLQTIKDKGVHKKPARSGMPGTTSLFGYQFRHDLSEGFPLLTTKKISFKNVVVELLWFLRGDTNIKYLVDNGCNIWNEDAYNFYLKQFIGGDLEPMSFEQFVERVKSPQGESRVEYIGYKLGDCGKQYGWLWRHWGGDQITELIKGLETNPMGRRHIISAWNPETLDDMALNACHALVQFNCRPLTPKEQYSWIDEQPFETIMIGNELGFTNVNYSKVPKYKLDCQLYQRSADGLLGVPYNIASYSLLVHMLCKMVNMIPGEFIHTFGDVHIYDNHMEQVDIQLTREPKELPTLDLSPYFIESAENKLFQKDLDKWIESLSYSDFGLNNYDSHPAIKAKLSTGLN